MVVLKVAEDNTNYIAKYSKLSNGRTDKTFKGKLGSINTNFLSVFIMDGNKTHKSFAYSGLECVMQLNRPTSYALDH